MSPAPHSLGVATEQHVDHVHGAEPLAGRTLISIGPQTSEALREAGLQPSAEATEHDVDGLVDAVVAAAS